MTIGPTQTLSTFVRRLRRIEAHPLVSADDDDLIRELCSTKFHVTVYPQTQKAVQTIDLPDEVRATYAAGAQDPRGDLMLSLLGAFAEFERAIIRERQAEGVAIAKAKGKYKGRKRVLTDEQVARARQRVDGVGALGSGSRFRGGSVDALSRTETARRP